ncbi:MAG TPA: restriction endonuclease subunit S [Muribaculaceae bacterium]|nr:restriction endonuclease subunit S [Muribaculaceae bacterium]
MENLAKYKLGYIAYIIGGVAYNPADICDNGIRILRGGNIQNKAIVTKSDDVFLPLEYSNGENQIQVGDTILVASTGSVEVLGKAATCFSDLPNTQIGAFIRIVRPKRPEYAMLISIALTSDYFARYIKAQAKGTSINNITIGYLKDFNIMCPHSFEPICSLYSKIEAKIALNREINRNLEAMARQLYDYWFVQFDFPDSDGKPYKSSGGKMVWNDKLKREIPVEWADTTISDYAVIQNGATPSTADDKNYNGDIVWITPKDLSDQAQKFTFHGERLITKNGYDSCSTTLLPIGTILMSSRAPIGLLSIAAVELCTNQGFKSLIPKRKQFSHFLYYLVEQYMPVIKQLGSGTTFSEVSKDGLSKLCVPLIPLKVIKEWDKIAEPIFLRQKQLLKEIATLAAQRDELLPLLMNGQVSVRPTGLNCDLSHD